MYKLKCFVEVSEIRGDGIINEREEEQEAAMLGRSKSIVTTQQAT